MEINKILSADILDIIFEGRYKEYGAYELRKSYNKRIAYALKGTVVICLVLFFGSILANSVKKKVGQILVHEVTLENIKTEEKKPDVPPPPPPKQDPPTIEITKFTPPKIVKYMDVKPGEEIKGVETLENAKIGNIDVDGGRDDGTVVPIMEKKGTGVIEAPKQEVDYDNIFAVVQIPAQFPGGLPAWSRYLERNLNSSLPVENGAPPAKYTVFVTFIVDKTGNISDVQAENDPGFGTKEEAIRVIKKGPAWIPAIQNDHKVIYRHKQGITFQVKDE